MTRFLITLLLCLLPAALHAAKPVTAKLRTTHFDRNGGTTKIETSLFFADPDKGWARLGMGNGSSGAVSVSSVDAGTTTVQETQLNDTGELFLTGGDTVTMSDHVNRWNMVFDPEFRAMLNQKMEQAFGGQGAAGGMPAGLGGMQEMIRNQIQNNPNMSEEDKQRALAAMAGFMPGGMNPGGNNMSQPVETGWVETNRTGTFDGKKFTVWRKEEADGKANEMDVVPESQIPGGEGIKRTFQILADIFGELKGADRLGDQFMAEFEAIGPNVPLRMRRFDSRGILAEETVLDIEVGVDSAILGSMPDPGYKDRDPSSGF